MDPGGEGWSRQRVEHRLIAAFRAMPSCPVYRHGRRLRPAEPGRDTSALTEVLNWARLLDHDPRARLYLWAWARCMATNASFAELCAGLGWKRSTAEVGRRRGAATLAAALGRGSPES